MLRYRFLFFTGLRIAARCIAIVYRLWLYIADRCAAGGHTHPPYCHSYWYTADCWCYALKCPVVITLTAKYISVCCEPASSTDAGNERGGCFICCCPGRQAHGLIIVLRWCPPAAAPRKLRDPGDVCINFMSRLADVGGRESIFCSQGWVNLKI